jgi:hypothetical protein
MRTKVALPDASYLAEKAEKMGPRSRGKQQKTVAFIRPDANLFRLKGL